MTSNLHPVALFELNETDPQFHVVDALGRSPRFMIEDVGGDQFCFADRAAADQFLDIHGLEPVSDSAMAQCRQSLGQVPKSNPGDPPPAGS